MSTQKINSPEQVNEVVPSAVTNTNDVWRCDNCGSSGWTGTINGIGGAVINYIHTSGNKNTLVPQSTSQLGKQRLYNTTRGNYALISDSNGSSTITLTANPPANWANTDVITTISQTVSGGGLTWVDIEIISGDFVGKSAIFTQMIMIDSGAAGRPMAMHPFESYADSKRVCYLETQVAGIAASGHFVFKLTTNIISTAWNPSGAATGTLAIREAGYMQ